MSRFDVCIAWNWEYDVDFIHAFQYACDSLGASVLQVTPENLAEVQDGLKKRNVAFVTLLDRASESDERFQPLVDWAKRHKVLSINPQKQTLWARDKATMHLEFIEHGLYTRIRSSSRLIRSIHPCTVLTWQRFNGCFAIKPACEGGGDGVILEASSWEQVQQARQQYPHEKYLLQAHIRTCQLEGRAAWFRVLVVRGAVYPCWWDQHSHIYTRVTAEEKSRFHLRGLTEVAARIAQICKLQLFSTEIALTDEGEFIVVDYVNDPVDLRCQSKAADGVPDAIVENIAHRLARLVKTNSPA